MIAIFILLSLGVLGLTITQYNTTYNNKYTANILTLALFIYVAVLLITTENTSIDMPRYLTEYYTYNNYSLIESFTQSTREPLFTLFQWLSAQFSSSPEFFYLAIWFVFGTTIITSLKKILQPDLVTIAFFCYLNFFLFFGYITNTVRQGFAIAFLLLAIVKFVISDKRSFSFYLLLIIPPLFHDTSLPLSIGLLLLSIFKLNTKHLMSLWTLFAVLFLTGLNGRIFSQLSAYFSDISAYSSTTTLQNYGGGTNRLDFFIFSTFFVMLFIFIKKYTLNQDPHYSKLTNVYILFNIFFLALGFVAYTDRIAAYSWFLIPMLLIYPLSNNIKYNDLILFVTVLAFAIVSIINGSILYNQPLFY